MATATRRGTLVARASLLAGAAATVLLIEILAAGISAHAWTGEGPASVPDSVAHIDRDPVMAWLARGLLVPAVLWVLIGILASRTRLVRRPGAAAARAAWLSATRPWRARESTLGLLRLDRWLLLAVPAALLVATRAVQTSFLSWAPPTITLAAWLVFALVATLVLGGRSPWPIVAAAGGVVVLRCIVALVPLAVTGPAGYRATFWTEPVPRAVYVSIATVLLVWMIVAAGWALADQIGSRRAVGTVLIGAGAGLAFSAVVIALVGVERALRADQVGLIPSGLAGMLGITERTDVPDAAAWAAAAIGLAGLVAGVLLALPWRRSVRDGRDAASEDPTQPDRPI